MNTTFIEPENVLQFSMKAQH